MLCRTVVLSLFLTEIEQSVTAFNLSLKTDCGATILPITADCGAIHAFKNFNFETRKQCRLEKAHEITWNSKRSLLLHLKIK